MSIPLRSKYNVRNRHASIEEEDVEKHRPTGYDSAVEDYVYVKKSWYSNNNYPKVIQFFPDDFYSLGGRYIDYNTKKPFNSFTDHDGFLLKDFKNKNYFFLGGARRRRKSKKGKRKSMKRCRKTRGRPRRS